MRYRDKLSVAHAPDTAPALLLTTESVFVPRFLVTFTDAAKAADGPRDNPDHPELSYPGLQDEEVVCDSLTADPADRDLYRAVGGEHDGASFSVQAVAQIEELREEVA